MSDKELVECPAPGCDYKSHEASVRGHWGGSRDDAHTGSFYKKFHGGEDGPSNNDVEAADSTASEAPSTSGGSNPAFDQPDPETRDTPSMSKETLPCCDNEIPSDELPDEPTRIRCGDCGAVLTYEP